MGNSQMDMYGGAYEVAELCEELHQSLGDLLYNKPELYRHELKLHGGYIVREITDHSIWVFRWGGVAERHIHVHPARNAPNIFRIKANALKTAVIAFAHFPEGNITTEQVNDIREAWLHLSPIKELRNCTEIWRTYELLCEKEKRSAI